MVHQFKSGYLLFLTTYWPIRSDIRGTTTPKLLRPVWPPPKFLKKSSREYVGIRASTQPFADLCKRFFSINISTINRYYRAHPCLVDIPPKSHLWRSPWTLVYKRKNYQMWMMVEGNKTANQVFESLCVFLIDFTHDGASSETLTE